MRKAVVEELTNAYLLGKFSDSLLIDLGKLLGGLLGLLWGLWAHVSHATAVFG